MKEVQVTQLREGKTWDEPSRAERHHGEWPAGIENRHSLTLPMPFQTDDCLLLQALYFSYSAGLPLL
jgi:hypothetical protein